MRKLPSVFEYPSIFDCSFDRCEPNYAVFSRRVFDIDRGSSVQTQLRKAYRTLAFVAKSMVDLRSFVKVGKPGGRGPISQRRLAREAGLDPAQVSRAFDDDYPPPKGSVLHGVGGLLGCRPEFLAKVRERDVLRARIDQVEAAIAACRAREEAPGDHEYRRQILEERVASLERGIPDARPFRGDNARELVFAKYRRSLDLSPLALAECVADYYGFDHEHARRRHVVWLVVLMVFLFEQRRLTIEPEVEEHEGVTVTGLVPISDWLAAIRTAGVCPPSRCLDRQGLEEMARRRKEAFDVTLDADDFSARNSDSVRLRGSEWRRFTSENNHPIFRVGPPGSPGTISIRRDATTFRSCYVEYVEAEQPEDCERSSLRIVNASHHGTEIITVLEGEVLVTCSRSPFTEGLADRPEYVEGDGDIVLHGRYQRGDGIVFHSRLYHRVEFLSRRTLLKADNLRQQID